MSTIAPTTEPVNHIAVFQETAIRRAWHAEEWWVSIIDVVGVLSESNSPNRYWSDLKRKLALEAHSGQPYEKVVKLKLTAPDGKQPPTAEMLENADVSAPKAKRRTSTVKKKPRDADGGNK